MRLTALALIECLGEAGYPISSGYFSELEGGTAYPKDADRFMAALASCLDLTDVQHRQLKYQLTYDVARSRLGENLANEFLGNPPEDLSVWVSYDV